MLRKRARKACLPCHKRKVKCNGDLPCNICQGYGYKCEYTADSERPAKKTQVEFAGSAATPLSASVLGNKNTAQLSRMSKVGGDCQQNRSGSDKNYMLVEVPNRKAPKLSSAPFHESLISRYTTRHSAVAFPRELSHSLGLSDAPRLHCFGWHTGTREEHVPTLGYRLFDQASLQDVLKYMDVYYELVHPFFGFLVPSHATQACIDAWNLKQMPIDVEATICGATALGSLFCPNTAVWELEPNVIQQAQHLLEISVSYPPSQLSLKFVIGWILRALYLRCTTRPHLSWIASCNAVHIAEAMGLHQEFRNMDALFERTQEANLVETTSRRKAFWIALSLNRLFSVEYGRSPLKLDSISCTLPARESDLDMTLDLIKICESLPSIQNNQMHPEEEMEALTAHLQLLAQISVQNSVLILLKAETCFALFRRMRFLRIILTTSQIEAILGTIRDGLFEAQSLSKQYSKWWNVVGVPFQSVLVLIAINTAASLEVLRDAMSTLEEIAHVYDTHLVREALQTATQVVQGLRKKRIQELHDIDRAVGQHNHSEAVLDHYSDLMMPMLPSGIDWPVESDGGWMEILLNTDMV